jgi:mannose/cellobiose epimerase-like protein (N-acyl-D-glucosamine 2-epimerase family)
MRSPTAQSATNARAAAVRLVDLAERYGVDPKRGVAMNSLRVDTSVRDAQARLWPQTERIKATCALAELTGESRYWVVANEAALALTKYLSTPVSGLWYDKLTADGQFIDEPAPASSFYHIVCAIAELEHAIKRAMPHDAH